MNVLYVFVLACQLAVHSSLVSAVRFPTFSLREILATSPNTTDDGPVPAACQQTCALIIPYALNGQSCTPDLCCSPQWEQSYYSCIICAASMQNITDLAMAQHTLDDIRADCAASGISLPLLTFPGQAANRTLPSASTVPSGSITVSPSGSGSLSGSGNATATATTSSSATSTQSRSAASSIQNQWPVLMSSAALAAFVLLL